MSPVSLHESLRQQAHDTPPDSSGRLVAETPWWVLGFSRCLRLCEAAELRVFTGDQARRYLKLVGPDRDYDASSDSRRYFERCLGLLAKGGKLQTAKPLVHPILSLDKPLVSWAPGEATPDFDAVAWQAARRWTAPPCPTCIYWVSERSAQVAGRVPPRPKLFQVSHDLHVTELCLRFLESSALPGWRWLSEDQVPKPKRRGYRVPDAQLVGPGGECVAVEFLGSYTAGRIRSFHEDCAARRLRYQGW